MSDDELPAVLSLLASSGGTARSVDTWQHDHMLALILGDKGGAPIAAMPMSRRTIRTAAGAVLGVSGVAAKPGATLPGRELSVGWLSSNQFTSRMSLRGQTRATANEWAGLLPELDALIVLRRDESSLAARWYTQTGFEEILSIRCLYLDMDAPPDARNNPAAPRYQVQVATPSDAAWPADRWQSQMFSVYNDVYASYGGPPLRSPAFWAPALAHHYYGQHYQFQILGLWSNADLMGYAVVGWSGWHSKRPRMDILELATRQWDTAVAAELIQTTCQLAWSKNVRQVRAVVSAHDPYRGHLTRTGFTDRWGYLMLAKWLHPQRFLDRIALPAEFGDLALELHSPGQLPLTLRRGANPRPLTLHANPRALTRLLLSRLDITAALQEGALTPAHGEPLPDPDLARLSLAFPWTPWAFHMLDYI
jgi:hypothetical protein